MEAREAKQRDPAGSAGRAVDVDLERGERAAGVLDHGDQSRHRLAGAVRIGRRQQSREVDLVTLRGAESARVAVIVVHDLVEQRRSSLRVRERRSAEHELVGTETADQRVGAGSAIERVVARAAGEDVGDAAAREDVGAGSADRVLDDGAKGDRNVRGQAADIGKCSRIEIDELCLL